ncbi:MAG: MBL fold metallo-hydrolase [Desulfobacula sp.]|uniref:MBL fold metallo-hydrolase RNA specificity domain-containing protein n=2 Tax=Desulfobacula sp. TaxID=2593537 RepID=UPI001D5CA08D|nr:MBL fold metallo-hydrolase [Desulfobacula sp.]MBT3484200.1 MBL fold metallo-hydrolase [Desulfobacula sp.]MBT3804326.1 MBL fold metallo-hydrolase [Desulfobacula sp.]MBT4026236.1 MBL fold metallo-hydrolase [Desulfobacula sp.]MBT4197690.1 MBL fold metallo-hydrolase [Desulfobacula sp.]
MDVTFLGAAGEVTGSMHLLDTGKDKILFDCGMFQGRRKESKEKNKTFNIDRTRITNMILSHAHIDHSGRIPVLTADGFSGRVVTTRPTADALEYMLMDSGHIQESDAQYLNYKSLRSFLRQLENNNVKQSVSNREKTNIKKLLKKNPYELNIDVIHKLQNQYELDIVTPLYTMNEARQSLGFIDGYPFHYPVTIGEHTTVKFYVAGHILGSAFSVVTIKRNDKTSRILYTGDIGRFGKPILKDPTLVFDEEDRDIDLFITESTYGDREHEPVEDLASRLKKVLNDTFERGGSVIIPSFAFGRTQELIYILHELYDKGEVPRRPVYVDSPLASNITRVFGEHPEAYDKETHETFLEKGKNPFHFDKIRFVQTVEESMRLTKDNSSSHVVISASGMCEAGRILHHLRYRVHDPKNTILLVGYMAENTLGRRIEELGAKASESGNTGEAPEIKILGKTYPLHAKVEKISGFSAHADKHELEKIITQSNLRIKKIGVVHGEETQSAAFAKRLQQKGYETIIPKPGDKISL